LISEIEINYKSVQAFKSSKNMQLKLLKYICKLQKKSFHLKKITHNTQHKNAETSKIILNEQLFIIQALI